MTGMTIVDGEPVNYGVISAESAMLKGALVARFGGEIVVADGLNTRPQEGTVSESEHVASFVRDEREQTGTEIEPRSTRLSRQHVRIEMEHAYREYLIEASGQIKLDFGPEL